MADSPEIVDSLEDGAFYMVWEYIEGINLHELIVERGPLSPHYADLFARWRDGDTVPLPFSEEAVSVATRSTLRLEPAGGG